MPPYEIGALRIPAYAAELTVQPIVRSDERTNAGIGRLLWARPRAGPYSMHAGSAARLGSVNGILAVWMESP